MKLIWLAVLLGLLVAGRSFAQNVVPLTALQPVSDDNIRNTTNQFSIADQIYSVGFYGWQLGSDDKDAVFNLGGKYTRVQGWIGIADGEEKGTRDRRYEIKVDGNSVLSGTTSYGDKPVHMDLDVTGARSLHIILGSAVYIGDPVLLKGTPQQAMVANLVAPASGSRATGRSVNLLWEPVDGAASYGVEIVCTKGSSPHIYALNVTGGDSNTKFDLTNVPNGEYQWSVIAFDGKGVMGKFSKDRTFIVAR